MAALSCNLFYEEAELRASYRAKLGLSVETPAETGAEKAYAEFLELRQKLGAELKGQGTELKELCKGEITWQGRVIVLTRDGVRYLYGEDENENLRGQSGNDVLIGNKGDDTLEGEQGDDTYVWAPGDGNDSIFDGVGRNVLKIGEGVDPSKVEVSRDGSHLYLRFKDTGEKLTLQYWYGGDSYQNV